jgi:TolB-like protein
MDAPRLAGWKRIADFVGRDVRTAQNWERERALPVHRLPGGKGSTVFAYAHEIAAWMDGGMQATACAPQQAVPGLLVLPFEFAAADPTHAFVADGLAQELIGRLAAASLTSVRVVSWTTARSYRAAGAHAPRLARELAIRYLVEGCLLSTLDRWTIDVRVVDALADRVILAHRFAGPPRDILLLQSDIAQAVAEHLALHLAGDLCEPMWTRPVDPRAFLSFLDGVRHLARGGEESTSFALGRFDEALRLDASLLPASAHKGLGLVQAEQHTAWLREDVQREVRRIARQCAVEGAGLISSAMLDGLIGRNDCDWQRADLRLGSAVASNPSAVAVRLLHAGNLTLRRRFDEAAAMLAPVAGLERSVEADKTIAAARLWSGDFAGAIERFDQVLAVEPTHVYAGMMRFMAAVYGGDAVAARQYYAALTPVVRGKYDAFLQGCLAILAGDVGAARSHRATVEAGAASARLAWYHVAMLDGMLGDAGPAADNLARSFAKREATCSLGAVDPSFRRVRDTPRFRSLLRAMGLPE